MDDDDQAIGPTLFEYGLLLTLLLSSRYHIIDFSKFLDVAVNLIKVILLLFVLTQSKTSLHLIVNLILILVLIWSYFGPILLAIQIFTD